MIRNNIAIRTRSKELVEFFYPNYTVLHEYSPFISGGVIFDGDSKYLQMFRDAGVKYIYIKGTPEFDLTIPSVLLNFVYDKWDKKPTKYLEEYFSSFDKVTDELEDICKQIWVSGKAVHEEQVEERISGLYSMLARTATYEIMKEYLLISEQVNSDKMFYSIKRFLKMSLEQENIKNVRTKQHVHDFVQIRGKNVQKALMQYLYSPADNVNIKLLKLVETLTNIEEDNRL